MLLDDDDDDDDSDSHDDDVDDRIDDNEVIHAILYHVQLNVIQHIEIYPKPMKCIVVLYLPNRLTRAFCCHRISLELFSFQFVFVAGRSATQCSIKNLPKSPPFTPKMAKPSNGAQKKPAASGAVSKAKSPKAQKYHKYAAKKASGKKARKAASNDLTKGAWEKVKIAGNLVTDDGGGLEGLIGLEVLEDYGAAVVATGGKRTYSENDIDENFELMTKNERKKKRVEYEERENEKKAAKKTKLKQQKEKAPKPGAFVKAAAAAAKTPSDDDSDDEPSDDDEEASDDDDGIEADVENSAAEEADSEEDEELLFNEGDVSDIEMEDDDGETGKTLTSADLVEWHKLGVHESILRALAEKNFREPTAIQALTLPAAIHERKDILGAAETGSGKTLAFGIPILNGILELKQGANNADAAPLRKVPKSGGKVTVEPVADGKKSKRKKLPRKGERDNMTPPPEELYFAPENGKKRGNVQAANESDDDEEDDAPSAQPLYALVLTPTRELCVQVKDHIVQAAKYTGIQVAAIFGGLAHVKQERVLRKCPEIVVATPGRLWELIRDGNEHLNKLRDIK